MSIINLEINLFMTMEIYVSRELSHPLHYQSSILFPITIHTVTYHTNTQSLHLSCLPTVPQYSQISHCFFFFSFFSLLTWYPFIISYSSIPSFKSFTAPLHLPLSSPYKVHSMYAGAVGLALPKAPHLSRL